MTEIRDLLKATMNKPDALNRNDRNEEPSVLNRLRLLLLSEQIEEAIPTVLRHVDIRYIDLGVKLGQRDTVRHHSMNEAGVIVVSSNDKTGKVAAERFLHHLVDFVRDLVTIPSVSLCNSAVPSPRSGYLQILALTLDKVCDTICKFCQTFDKRACARFRIGGTARSYRLPQNR